MSDSFPYSEAKLADELGISRTDLKTLRDRKLTVGSDWKKNGAGVVLSVCGLKAIRRAGVRWPAGFDLAACLVPSSAEKNGPAANGSTAIEVRLGDVMMPIPVAMTVTRICLNPAMVLAQPTGGLDRRTVSVWVGSNLNFAVGMKIQVAPKKNTPGVWAMAGPAPQRSFTDTHWNRMQEALVQP